MLSVGYSSSLFLQHVLALYGDGGEILGCELEEFFGSVTIPGAATELCKIMSAHGSDKGGGWHNYTLLYDFLLHERRSQVRSVFEVGIGTNNLDVPSNMGAGGRPGASLRGWREYFSQAQIFGADVDQRILFSEEKPLCNRRFISSGTAVYT
jgi:hypothetical protein